MSGKRKINLYETITHYTAASKRNDTRKEEEKRKAKRKEKKRKKEEKMKINDTRHLLSLHEDDSAPCILNSPYCRSTIMDTMSTYLISGEHLKVRNPKS